MRVKSLTARPILDSRGSWTIEVRLGLGAGATVTASVPQGKSTGSHEVVALPAKIAVRNINTIIAPKLKRAEFRSQDALDAFLNKLDGTPTKKKLGGNSTLAISIAFARASAAAKGVPLWGHIRSLYGVPVPSSRDVTHPRLFMNLINGGVHGGSNLDIQEYVIIPKTRTFAEAVRVGVEVRNALGEAIAWAKGKQATNLGDEGGYAPNFKNNIEPIHILKGILKKLHYEKLVDFGMDAAATDIKGFTDSDLVQLYEKLIREYNIIYLEDPFAEERFEEFAKLTERFGDKVWITGDDLTTTNVRRMERAHAEGSVNGVIIKPNQIGTVTEALDAVRLARKYGWKVIASHRSGETNDDFIADFAYGVGADGLKLGAPARGERIAKYNRLLAIEAGEE
ncbi:MAG: enolase C-terminal domain-like protein [bacterium]|nr:enolase C-terminal domain-like protein [bacterium]